MRLGTPKGGPLFLWHHLITIRRHPKTPGNNLSSKVRIRTQFFQSQLPPCHQMKATNLLVPLPAPSPSGAARHLLNDPKNHFKSQNCSSDGSEGSALSDSDLRRTVGCRLTAASCMDIAAWQPLVRQTQWSKATLALSSCKPAPLRSPGNRAKVILS